MADLKLTEAQKNTLFKETLQKDYSWTLDTSGQAYALIGQPKVPAAGPHLFDLIDERLKANGFAVGGMFNAESGTSIQRIAGGTTVINVDQKDLRRFVELTGVDFTGKSIVLPDLADKSKQTEQNLMEGFKKSAGAGR